MQPLWWHAEFLPGSKSRRLTSTLLFTQYGDESSRLQERFSDFLRNSSKDEKNAYDFYKLLLKILCKVSRFCFYLFFLWKVEFVFKGTASWGTAEYLTLLSIQVHKMSHLSFPSFLPFRSTSVSSYSIFSHLEWPLVFKSLPSIKNGLCFSSLSCCLHFKAISLCFSSFWQNH